MFVDYAKIELIAGKGGAGRVSFRREKFVPKGGPDGGDGGNGGNIIFKVNANLHTLQDFRYHRKYSAGNGEPGGSGKCTGKNGEDIIINVPPGTIIRKTDSKIVVADLTNNGDEFIACRGGKGGKGNFQYRSAVNQAPRKSQTGLPGESDSFELELKVLADVGLVGLPNAGKSTLLSVLSAARPKIADYPFTTLQPHLGIVKYGEYRSFVLADIPGLIEGASSGKGLGHQFLRHIERNRLLLYMIDANEPRPEKVYKTLRNELKQFNSALMLKQFIIVRTKVDSSPEISDNWKNMPNKYLDISSITGTGIKELVDEITNMLESGN